MLDLNEIRNNIDKIDSQLVELFEERMKLTTEVAEYKIETGKKVLDPAREKAKLESVKKLVKNPDNVHAIDDLFAQIMANSRKSLFENSVISETLSNIITVGIPIIILAIILYVLVKVGPKGKAKRLNEEAKLRAEYKKAHENNNKTK